VRTRGQAVIGQGIDQQPYLATVTVDNAGTTSVGFLSHWAISDTLTGGNNLRGQLLLSNGGIVAAFKPVQMGVVGRVSLLTMMASPRPSRR
jgi:hypothetical protein